MINQVTGKESLFENSPFDDNTRSIVAKSTVSVGLMIDKGFDKLDHIFIPIFSIRDTFLIIYAQKLINNSNSQVTILDASGEIINESFG